MRWTTAGEPRRFSGTLSVEAGRLEAIPTGLDVTLERVDERTLRFSARTAGGLVGLDLPGVRPPVRLDLFLDDAPCPYHAIRLGAGEVRPRRGALRLEPTPPPESGLDHHDHVHPHPHPPGAHHHHPHPHPHPPGMGHHHPR